MIGRTMRPVEAIALVVVLIIVLSMYRAHRDENFKFNLFDLVMENGRVSRLAVVFFAAFLFHTWVLWRLTLDGKITEGYLTFYGMTYVAPMLALLFRPYSPPAAPVESPK